MKIEKISDNQIRCTLTSADLSSRQIRLSELAYGSDKAKELFHDMLQEAEYTVGFTLDNSPLMIEAIPTSVDSIVLVITKVDDPEELDTRFSRFTKSDEDTEPQSSPSFIGADDILGLFEKIYEARKAASKSQENAAAKIERPAPPAQQPAETGVNLVQSFLFASMDDLIRAAQSLQGVYNGSNAVYRLEHTPAYQLVLHQSDCTPEEFNKVCNILSEYGKSEPFSPPQEAYLREHGHALVRDGALQKLATLPV